MTLTTTNTAIIKEEAALNADLFNRWINYIDVSERTADTYNKAIRRFIKYLQDNGINQPERNTIIEYREYLKESLKPATVQSYITATRLFFEWTEAENLYPNIAKHIKGQRISKEHKKDYLTTRQCNKIFEGIDTTTLQGKRDYAILALMVTTGLRCISIANANIEDIKVVADEERLYYKGKGRDEKGEYVELTEPVLNAIEDYLRARGVKDAAAPLFASIANQNNGGRMTTRSISRIAKTHFKDAGIDSERITAHSLRHTAAIQMILGGAELQEVQEILGHKSITTTMIYVTSLDRSKNKSVQKASKAIFGK